MLVFRARPRKNPTQDAKLTNSERRMMGYIRDAVDDIRDQVARDEGKYLDAVAHLSANRVASMVPTEPWTDAQEKIRDELLAELIDAGKRVKLPPMEKATASFRFDATRPEAARWAEKEAGALIREVVQEQVNVVRDYVARADLGEATPRQIARGLRDVIGLTERQAGWVENFRNKQINERMLDGMTFDQAYEASERATDRYHRRVHRNRTETIARTEILRSVNEGRNQAWNQGVEEGWITPDEWRREWSTEIDGRQCSICGPLNETQVGFRESFPQGDPPIHPNCRCDVILAPAPVDDDIAAMSDEELDTYIDELTSGEKPQNELSIDERLAQLEAERGPIVERLLAADYGQIELSREEYDALVAQQAPMWDEINQLREQKLQAAKRPPVRPNATAVRTFEELQEGLEYGPQSRDAMQQWQGDGYRRVQGALYEGGSAVNPDTQAIIDGLDDAMDFIPEGVVLYRGQTRGLDNLEAGSTLSNNGFVSTSTDPITAGAFSQSAGQVTGGLKEGDTATILRITPRQARGATIPNSSEFEIVLERGTDMTVTGITEETIDGIKFRIVEVEA